MLFRSLISVNQQDFWSGEPAMADLYGDIVFWWMSHASVLVEILFYCWSALSTVPFNSLRESLSKITGGFFLIPFSGRKELTLPALQHIGVALKLVWMVFRLLSGANSLALSWLPGAGVSRPQACLPRLVGAQKLFWQ